MRTLTIRPLSEGVRILTKCSAEATMTASLWRYNQRRQKVSTYFKKTREGQTMLNCIHYPEDFVAKIKGIFTDREGLDAEIHTAASQEEIRLGNLLLNVEQFFIVTDDEIEYLLNSIIGTINEEDMSKMVNQKIEIMAVRNKLRKKRLAQELYKVWLEIFARYEAVSSKRTPASPCVVVVPASDDDTGLYSKLEILSER